MSNIISKDAKVLSLKVMVNKEKTKVLFAEADSDFVDVLLSFLTLPLGRIVKLLEKHFADKSPVLGSITSLYKGLANIDYVHFSTTAAKKMLLDTRSSSDSICRNLKLDITDSTATEYFAEPWQFEARCAEFYKNICMYYGGTARCDCGKPLNTPIFEGDCKDAAGGFTKKNAYFLISDDLRMVPYSVGFFQSLSNLGVTGEEGAELRNITLGTNEVTSLLMCCLLFETPLTDFILNNGRMPLVKPKPGCYLHKIEKQESSNCKKIILKVMVQKSTNKLLFAQAGEDFIELLFNFLIIPIGGVESLLDKKTCLNNLDNLYRSISDVSVDDYFVSEDTKKRLINPTIPYFFKSKNTFLPLFEESAPALYYSCKSYPPTFSHKFTGKETTRVCSFKSPKGDGNYVMGPTTFMVTDDLTVTPFCMSESFSFLDRLNIPLSDVDELEFPIGLQEGLSILKASFTSNSALTNGLLNHITRKQPKQEH